MKHKNLTKKHLFFYLKFLVLNFKIATLHVFKIIIGMNPQSLRFLAQSEEEGRFFNKFFIFRENLVVYTFVLETFYKN